MKNFIFLTTIILLSCSAVLAQNQINDWLDPNFESAYERWQANPTKSAQSYVEIVSIAVDSGASTLLPSWFADLMDELPNYFDQASFGNFNYSNYVLKKDENNAFMMPQYHLPQYGGGCEHVHLMSNIRAVLDSADLIYDFSDYDFDDNGVVYLHFTSIGPKSGGVAGPCLTYRTNDTTTSGAPIDVIVNKQTRGSSDFWYSNVFYHESGHDFFAFPDMEHSGTTSYNHYGVGSFDVMSLIGFEGVPSLYNPFFRHDRNWFTPTTITTQITSAVLEDFQMNENCYVYIPSSLPSNATSYERFYISYHTYDEIHNYYYSKWPYANQNLGGVLIWHTEDDTVTKWGSYSNWRKMDVDIECAHGKYDWTTTIDTCINTGAENPLNWKR